MSRHLLIVVHDRNQTAEVITLPPGTPASTAAEVYMRAYAKRHLATPGHSWQAHDGDLVSALVGLARLIRHCDRPELSHLTRPAALPAAA